MAVYRRNADKHEKDTNAWIKALTESLLPDRKDGSKQTQNDNKEWIKTLAQELIFPKGEKERSTFSKKKGEATVLKGDEPSGDLKKEEDKSSKKGSLTEAIEPYMEPLKKMKRAMVRERKDEKLTAELVRRKALKKESKKQTKRIEKELERQPLTCECFPPPTRPFSPVPPYPTDPCTCYGPDSIKPGPEAGYLGMGYAPPRVQGPEFKRVPGARLIIDELPNYSVTSFGRGLIPSFDDTGPDPPQLIVHSFLLTGENGFQVEVSQLGARVVAIRAPDAQGKVDDVILGFDRPKEYIENKELHWGGVVGRIADRVRGPRPQIYVPGYGYVLLSENDERDHYMGGNKSFDLMLWEAHVRPSGVLFTLMSPAGSDGFPGSVILSVTYSVEPMNRLVMRTEAMSTAATPLALSLPLAFNLAGHAAGEESLMNHVLNIRADKYYITKPPSTIRGTSTAPEITGLKKSVGHTPYDFRVPRKLGKMINHTPKKMYDNIFCPSEYKPENKPQCVAKIKHPHSRRTLEVWSDLPVLRVSTNLGLPEGDTKFQDPTSTADVYAIIKEIVTKVPTSKWMLIDSEPEIILAGGDRIKQSLPHGDEKPPSAGPLRKIPPALLGMPMRIGYGDQRPAHPGIKALPMAERGPNRLPFDSATMDVLISGGVTRPQSNPVGSVEPDPNFYGKDFDVEGKDRSGSRTSTQLVKEGNLRPSKVGSVPRRVQSEILRPSKLERHGGTLTDLMEKERSSLADQFARSSSVFNSRPRSKSMPPDDSLERILNKPSSGVNEPPFYSENRPEVRKIDRLRGGADYPASEQWSTGQDTYADPYSQYHDADPYSQYHDADPYSQYHDAYPDTQYADQWSQPQGGYYYYPPANVAYDPSGDGHDPSAVEPNSANDQEYNNQPPVVDQSPTNSDDDPSTKLPDGQVTNDQVDEQPNYQNLQPPVEPPRESLMKIGDESVPPVLQSRFYSVRSIWEGPTSPSSHRASVEEGKWPWEEPPPPPIGRWPGTRYDRQSFGEPEQLFEPRQGTDQFRTSGLGSIFKDIGKVPSTMRGQRRSSDESIVMRHELPFPPALENIDLENVEVDPPKPPDRLSNINLYETLLEGMHLEDTPQNEVPDVVRYLYAKPTPKGFETQSKEEVNKVVRGLLDDILDRIKSPPRYFRGFNDQLYSNNTAIMLMPLREPLYKDKSNTENIILRPGKTYKQTIMYVFGIREKKPPQRKRPPMGQSEPAEADMIDHCSVDIPIESESTDTFQGLHDNCSEQSVHTSQTSI